MKSLLLGSAATFVVVAGAQAADLPTKKGAPAAEYVKVCKVGDIAGFIIPGSDTCLKISGYVNAQIAVGNVTDERQIRGRAGLSKADAFEATTTLAKYVSDIGFSTRGQVNFDAVTNTAMGPLLAHIEIQSNSGTGFDPLGNGAVLNAGLRAMGRHHRRQARLVLRLPRWRRHLEGLLLARPQRHPDPTCWPIPRPSAAASRPRCRWSRTRSVHGSLPCGTTTAPLPATSPTLTRQQRHRARRARARHHRGLGRDARAGAAPISPASRITCASTSATAIPANGLDTWGYGVIGGVTFNLPMLGAGSKIAFQGAYAHGAIGYSGAGSPAGASRTRASTPTATARCSRWPTRSTPATAAAWTLSNAWSAAAQLTWKVSPNFEIDPEIAYASVDYGSDGGQLRASVAEGHRLVGRRGVRLVAGQEPRLRARRRLRVVASVDAGRLDHGERRVPERRRRLQRPPARRPLVLIERAKRLQISAPERKLRGFLLSAGASCLRRRVWLPPERYSARPLARIKARERRRRRGWAGRQPHTTARRHKISWGPRAVRDPALRARNVLSATRLNETAVAAKLGLFPV